MEKKIGISPLPDNFYSTGIALIQYLYKLLILLYNITIIAIDLNFEFNLKKEFYYSVHGTYLKMNYMYMYNKILLGQEENIYKYVIMH